jgi:hypothetical protein
MFEIVSHQINAIDFLLEVISSVASNSKLIVDDYFTQQFIEVFSKIDFLPSSFFFVIQFIPQFSITITQQWNCLFEFPSGICLFQINYRNSIISYLV